MGQIDVLAELTQVTQFAVQNGLNKGKKADFQQKS